MEWHSCIFVVEGSYIQNQGYEQNVKQLNMLYDQDSIINKRGRIMQIWMVKNKRLIYVIFNRESLKVHNCFPPSHQCNLTNQVETALNSSKFVLAPCQHSLTVLFHVEVDEIIFVTVLLQIFSRFFIYIIVINEQNYK